MTRPNILFLSIDALRFDRTSLHGYALPTTPTLARLAENAIVCNQTSSSAAFTQPSLPSMLTSTMPLSYGGYDNGAIGRPASLFKVLHDVGYETTMLSTFPWVNRFFGYSDGVDHEHFLFVLNSLVGIAGQRMRSTLHAHTDNTISTDDLIQIITPIIEGMLSDIEIYCQVRTEQKQMNALDMKGERLVIDGHDFPAVHQVVSKHRTLFRNDPRRYIVTYLSKVPQAHEWVARDWRMKRQFSSIITHGLRRFVASFITAVRPEHAKLSDYSSKRYVDGASLTTRIINVIDRSDKRQPFFIWSHYLDTHTPYLPGAAPGWAKKVPGYLSRLGYPEDIDPAIAVSGAPKTNEGWAGWSALYDAAVLYVDEQINRLQRALAERGLADNTIIVITGDHGEELGEHGDISHHFRMYEHNIRVPMFFHIPGSNRLNVDALTSTIDLAPTIAALVGAEAPTNWRGVDVTSDAVHARTHVIAEAFHSGNCLFDSRPPYITIRTKKYKYLWKEYRDQTDRFSPEGLELFNIEHDPMEMNNIYGPEHPALPSLNRAVAERLAEIPEISSDRIERALGSAGIAAVAKIRDAKTAKET